MRLQIDTRFTFIAGVLTLLLFMLAGSLSATPVGLVGACLIGAALGAFRRPSFVAYAGGIISALSICCAVGLLFGESLSAAIVMVPFILMLVLLYAGAAFFVGRLGVILWHRITSHSTRTR